MKLKSRKKGRKKSRKKGRTGKLLLFLLLIGLGGFIVYLFRQEISHVLKPPVEKEVVKREKKVMTLFFSEEEGEYLVGEKRQLLKRGGVEEEAREAVLELIKGPKGKLIPTLPAHTRLLALQIDQSGVAKVDFDQTLSKEHPGGSSAEMLTIYSIVNSLTLNFPQIKRVQILINGEKVESIAGHISLKQPLSSNLSMIKK
jgi:spore germination protein GerM